MMRGEIDFLYEVAPDALEFVKNENSVAKFSFLRNYVHAIIFNSRRPVFADSRVKRALNYAVDRVAIINQAFNGQGVPAHTPTWPQHWANGTDIPSYSFDPARAAALLDSAGLSVTGNGEHGPARLRFTCIFPTSLLWERMGLLVQRNLSEIGVDMQLEQLPLEAFNQRIATGDFDAVLMDSVVGNATSRPYFFWYSTSKRNPWGYHNPDVDAALDHLRYSPNDEATRVAFHDLQARMLENPPGIALAFGETTRAVSRRFQPVTPPGGDVFRTIAEWRLAESRAERSSN